MQISLRDIAETTLEGFSGLVEIDHSDDPQPTSHIENAVQTLASTAITAEETAKFDQMTAGIFTAEERAALPTLDVAPAAGEIIFNDPNLVQDYTTGAPQQEVTRADLIAAAPPAREAAIAYEDRRAEDVFAYAERIGDNIQRAHTARLSGSPHHQQVLSHDLKVEEAKIGGTLFGETPKGDTRTFFNLDTYTWVWNEISYDAQQKTYVATNVEYDFQPQGVLKVINGEPSKYIEGGELTMILGKMKTYHDRVLSEVYGLSLAA